jgi:hypothetical protein
LQTQTYIGIFHFLIEHKLSQPQSAHTKTITIHYSNTLDDYDV